MVVSNPDFTFTGQHRINLHNLPLMFSDISQSNQTKPQFRGLYDQKVQNTTILRR